MAARRKGGTARQGQASASAKVWESLTWEDLEKWAGSRSVSRGRTYQRRGCVENLVMSEDGRLLATVIGGDHYATSVWRTNAKRGGAGLESKCSCPVGHNGCKHAVAVVAAYLQLLADQAEVAPADPNDRRWARLAGAVDGDNADEDYEDDDETVDAVPAAGRRTRDEWDQKIRASIAAKGREELVELVWSLTERFSELREEFRERIVLTEGDVDRLVVQARRELRALTAETGWRNRWDGEGHTPDYSRLRHRLERLAELGHCDAVVKLGRELIKRGLEQVGQSHDEGETAEALGECLPTVFDAVARSSLSGPEKLLFAIDALLQDDYGVIGEAADPILAAEHPSADWSKAADALAGRLKPKPAGQEGAEGEGHRNYQRDGVSGWLLEALDRAGRHDELLGVYEREARATGSYERLVSYLIGQRRYDDAERWAAEGIERTRDKLPGIAAHLAGAMCEVARARGQWDVVAAHAAWEFFDQPGVETFRRLLTAAAKAGCREKVCDAALRFLETGVAPSGAAQPGKTDRGTPRSADWPLPVPGYLASAFRDDRPGRRAAQPHYGVLIELAIAEKRPDDALQWFDRMGAGENRSRGARDWYGAPSYADRIAEAVARSHPERALEIYRRSLEANLREAHMSAYETAAGYLRKMRPLLKSLGREEEWSRLLEDIRQRYRNRPRFMEILDGLDGRTILQAQRSRGRRS